MKRLYVSLFLASFVIFGLMGPGGCIPTDEDWDGITDDEDNCVSNFNPSQSDEDGDGVGDACDRTTPMHDATFANCYKSNWNLRGRFWEDIETGFTPTGRGTFDAYLLFPDLSGPTIETGPGTHDGEEIWFMTQSLDHTSYYATYVEGKVVETDRDGTATMMKGSYIMLVCEDCSYGDVPEYWDVQIPMDEWTAEIMPDDFCDGEQF